MYKFRKANLSDYDCIASFNQKLHELHVSNRPDVYKETSNILSFENFKSFFDSLDFEYFIVYNEKDNIPVGYACARILVRPETEVTKEHTGIFFNEFYIGEKFRRVGLGKRLFDFIIKYYNSLGFSNFTLTVWDFNEGAIEFYKSLGFKVRNYSLELSTKIDKK